MEERIVILNNEDEQLIGLRAIPHALKAKNPAALLVHGFHYFKEEDGMFDDIARLLSERGVIVYRFDFSGCGESEGDFQKKNLTKSIEDLSCMFNAVLTDPQVDCDRIGIISQSAGTCYSIGLNPAVQWMVFLGTVAHPKEGLIRLFGSGYNPNGLSIRYGSSGSSSGKKTVIEQSFWMDLERYDILGLVPQIRCPKLFIHGAQDDIVPHAEMEAVFNVANEPKEKILIENADHGMVPNRQGMYTALLAWLEHRI